MAKPQVYWSLCLRSGCLSARCALGGLTVNCPTPNSTPPRASVGTCILCVIYLLLTQLYTKLGPVTIRLWVVRGLLGRTPRYLGRCRTGATLLALSYGCDSVGVPVVLVLPSGALIIQSPLLVNLGTGVLGIRMSALLWE